MQSKMIQGVTRVIGKSQGYLGLAVRDEITNDKVHGYAPQMVTSWEPLPDELQRLNAGAPIILKLLGNSHPPVILEVGEIPEQV